jgi:hypothetical protein
MLLTVPQLTDMLKLVFHEKPGKLSKNMPFLTKYLLSEWQTTCVD